MNSSIGSFVTPSTKNITFEIFDSSYHGSVKQAYQIMFNRTLYIPYVGGVTMIESSPGRQKIRMRTSIASSLPTPIKICSWRTPLILARSILTSSWYGSGYLLRLTEERLISTCGERRRDHHRIGCCAFNQCAYGEPCGASAGQLLSC